jgi:hypothetical protein
MLHNHLSSGAGTISGRRTKWTQSHPTPRKLKLKTTLGLLDHAVDAAHDVAPNNELVRMRMESVVA